MQTKNMLLAGISMLFPIPKKNENMIRVEKM